MGSPAGSSLEESKAGHCVGLPSPQQQHANLLCSTTPDKVSGRAALRLKERYGKLMT
jgi:hypothetical protein